MENAVLGGRLISFVPQERWLSVLAITGAGMILLWVISDIAGRVLSDDDKVPASGPDEQVQTKSVEDYKIQDIVSAHLFGKVRQQVVKQEAAPRTRLRLKLVGMVASNDPQRAIALISSNNGPSMSYRVDDVIKPSGAKVRNIDPDKVIIERSGRLESLYIERPTLEEPETSRPNSTQNHEKKNAAGQANTNARNKIPVVGAQLKASRRTDASASETTR